MKGQIISIRLRIITVIIFLLGITSSAFAEEWRKLYPNLDKSIIIELDQGKELIMTVDYNTLDIDAVVLDADGFPEVYAFLVFLFFDDVKRVGVWDLYASVIGQPWVYLQRFEMSSL